MQPISKLMLMKRLFILLAISLALYACNEQPNVPTGPGGNGGGGGTTPTTKVTKYYVTGYKLYNVEYQDKYYYVSMECVNKKGVEGYEFSTSYTPKLNSSNLPYEYRFTTRHELEDVKDVDYYTIKVWWDNTTEYNQSECLVSTIPGEDVYLGMEYEFVRTSANGKTKVGIFVQYEQN